MAFMGGGVPEDLRALTTKDIIRGKSKDCVVTSQGIILASSVLFLAPVGKGTVPGNEMRTDR